MLKNTRAVKSLCILSLLTLPVIFISSLLLVNLFQQISAAMETLDDWAYYLIISLCSISFFPLPPPSRKRLKTFKRILVLKFRKVFYKQSTDPYSIKDDLDISSAHEENPQEFSLSLEPAYSPPHVKLKKSRKSTIKLSQIMDIRKIMGSRLKTTLNWLTYLFHPIYQSLSSFFLHIRTFFLQSISGLGEGICKIFNLFLFSKSILGDVK